MSHPRPLPQRQRKYLYRRRVSHVLPEAGHARLGREEVVLPPQRVRRSSHGLFAVEALARVEDGNHLCVRWLQREMSNAFSSCTNKRTFMLHLAWRNKRVAEEGRGSEIIYCAAAHITLKTR